MAFNITYLHKGTPPKEKSFQQKRFKIKSIKKIIFKFFVSLKKSKLRSEDIYEGDILNTINKNICGKRGQFHLAKLVIYLNYYLQYFV